MHIMNPEEKRPTVLIVDDEPLVRKAIVRGLEAFDYHCLAAGSVDDALREVSRQTPDAVIADIRLPGATGLDLLLALRKRDPDMQVLMLTGFSSVDTAIAALTHGAFGYLTKPIDPEVLHQQLQRALQHRQMLIERREYTGLLEETVSARTRELKETHEELTQRLVRACCCRDQDTGAHIRRVELLSGELASVYGWSDELSERMRVAAPLHDIGKTAIPDEILCKPGRFSAHEFSVMKNHATIGAELLDHARSPVLQMAREIALSHHERWDGAGYPQGIAGLEIPESARIVAIADVFDALSHDRVYRPAFPEHEVVEMLSAGRGTQFDPEILDCFLQHLPQMIQIAGENPDHTNDASPAMSAAIDVIPDELIHDNPVLCGVSSCSTNRNRVLIVDDEPMVREIALRAFAAAGLDCESAEDGAIAAEKFAQQPFDVVITDLHMPNRNGHSLAVELVEHSTQPIVIVITAGIEPRLASDLKQRGVTHIADKPVDHSELADLTINLLRTRSSESPQPPDNSAALCDGEDHQESPLCPPGQRDRSGSLLEQSNVDCYFYCMSDEHTSDDVTWLLKQNPQLSEHVVDRANASIPSTSRHVCDIRDAVVRLGRRRIGKLALAERHIPR